MSRKNTQAINSIQRICQVQKLVMDDIYTRAKLLLSIYRDVCWSTAIRAEELEDNLVCYCSNQLSDALVYLETFAPQEKKAEFEERVQSLFETRWMIELVDNAMLKVREFPHNGILHHEILSRCYLDKFKYTESDLLELLSIERSTYSDRKKEAVYVFGISLWGDALPKMMKFIDEVADEMKLIPEGVICGRKVRQAEKWKFFIVSRRTVPVRDFILRSGNYVP